MSDQYDIHHCPLDSRLSVDVDVCALRSRLRVLLTWAYKVAERAGDVKNGIVV